PARTWPRATRTTTRTWPSASRARPPARTSSTSSGTRTIRPRTSSVPARKSCARWAASSTPSCSAAAARAPWPAGPRASPRLRQVGGKLGAIVFGCGSSGTMTGLSRCFASASPATELILADPVGSILEDYINRGEIVEKSASWMVEGIGEDFLPPISDFTRVRKAYAIGDKESFLTARELLEKEGILGGSSTGTLLAAALRYCREQTEPKTVLTFVCDTGNKYLSKMYNDYWMLDNGFLEREQHGDLRDLILRPFSQRDTVVVAPADLLVTASQR